MHHKMSELSLLIDCINTEGEAESNGIKYIYMDENTIYRFENNRMKKISKTLINKAKKQINLQNTIPVANDTLDEPINRVKHTSTNSKSKSNSKSRRQTPQTDLQPEPDDYNIDDSNDLNNDDEYDDDEPVVKQSQQQRSKQHKRSANKQLKSNIDVVDHPSINLDEYYNNKNQMKYMNLEITRLNNKIDKLKQYKAIVNKLTGNEFDYEPPQQQYQSAQPTSAQPTSRYVNDSLFMY